MADLTPHSSLSKFRSAEDGIAAVEFAIVVPLLLILLVGIIDFGRLLTDHQAINKSVRDATRFLTRVKVDCAAAGSGAISTYLVDPSYATIAQNLALTGKASTPTVPSDYLLPYWTDPATLSMTVNCVANGGNYAGVFTDLAYIPRITVTADVPFSFLFGTIVFSSANITLSAFHNEVNVGE